MQVDIILNSTFFAVFIDFVANSGWFLCGWINDCNLANPYRLSDFNDSTLWVGSIWLHVSLNNVDTLNSNFVFFNRIQRE